MRALVYRLISLVLRFGCPLFILSISSSEVLGKYYLFIAFFTFVIFLISLETAIPFSKTYLRVNNDFHKRSIFSSFIGIQLLLASFLAAPITLFYSIARSVSLGLAVLFFLTVVSSAALNEAGRFFWNVGQGEIASKRDFWISVAFVLSMSGSVFVTGEVVTIVSLGFLTVFNFVLIHKELKKWGSGGIIGLVDFSAGCLHLKRTLRRLYRSVKASAPQVVHIQLLSAYPFLERTLLESKVGLSMVGSYSFQFSLIQSGMGLLLIPKVSDVRKAILSAKNTDGFMAAHRKSIDLFYFILIVGLIGAIITHFMLPLILMITHKTIETHPVILGTALIASIAGVFANAISPIYASKNRLLVSNIITLFCMTPMVLFYVVGTINEKAILWSMGAVALSAVLQTIARIWFHMKYIFTQRERIRGKY